MSKFPSIEEIDQDLETGDSSVDFSGATTEGDFLSREKAVLGDDAELFSSAGVAAESTGVDADVSGFEASFPSLEPPRDTSLLTQPEESSSGSTAFQTGGPEPPAINKLSLDDSEPVQEWRARQQLEIEQRDKLSETKRDETRESARKAIDDFYENYNTKKDDAIEQTRNEEKKFLEERDNSVSGGTTWDRIAKLIDTSDKGTRAGGRDKTRFKEVLLSLRGNPDVPGAGGY